MEKVLKALRELKKINSAYDLSNEFIDTTLQEASTAKVCTPLLGKFSSGKSSLLNAFLGYSKRILGEDITPETAFPAEISYGEADAVAVVYNDGTQEHMSVADYRDFRADASKVRCSQLTLRNSSLQGIPDVMLVDLPGFESGYEVHNRAIDNYLPQSLAYIVTFPVSAPVIKCKKTPRKKCRFVAEVREKR